MMSKVRERDLMPAAARDIVVRRALCVIFSALVFFSVIMTAAQRDRPAAVVPAEASSAVAAEDNDIALYAAVVSDMKAGRSYYDALGNELRTRGFPTRSVFNWRSPLLLTSLAATSPAVGTGVLLALSVAFFVAAGLSAEWGIATILVLTNTVASVAPGGAVYFGEAWAGVLIGLSLQAYLRKQFEAAAAVGLIALFMRELAAPYCVVCTLLALKHGRRRELLFWIAGAAAYAVYFGVHLSETTRHIEATDLEHARSWLFFGGPSFLFEVWRFNGILEEAPRWVLAGAVTALVLAMWAPRMPAHLRLSVLAYAVFFLCIGQTFNNYWGYIVAPANTLFITYGRDGFDAWWWPERTGPARTAANAPS
jgi:hypothetical protein